MKRISIILLLLLILGCQQNNNQIQEIETHVGTEGLQIDFLQNAPPSEIFEREMTGIGIKLTNEGSYDINDGVLVVSHETDYFDLQDQRKDFELQGKTRYNPVDDTTQLFFDAQAREIDELREMHRSLIIATACYDYETTLSTSICIDTDIYETKSVDKVCEVTPLSFSGQGAPLAITRIEQKIINEGNYLRPQFRVYVRNLGDGEVVSPGKTDQVCSGLGLEREDMNGFSMTEFRFSGYSLSGGDVTCQPEVLRLNDDEDFFVCTLDKDTTDKISKNRPSYVSDLNIKMDYGYTKSISREILIQKI